MSSNPSFYESEITSPEVYGEIYYPSSDGEPMAETDVHRDLMVDLIRALQNHYRHRPDVYVTGNIMFYYVEGNPRVFLSPDVMVCFGVANEQHRVYQVWRENNVVPSVIFELSSRSTANDDLEKKKRIYAELGVDEYYVFDPEYDYLNEPLLAFRLENNKYVDTTVQDGRVFSSALGLEVVDTGRTLRLFDSENQEFLLTQEEEHLARVQFENQLEEEREARFEAQGQLNKIENQLENEREARLQVESELARLRAELERLRQSE